MNLRLSLAVAALFSQGVINFQDPQKSITLRNFSSEGFELDVLETGLEFRGTGEPLSVELRDQGIVIRGRRMDGTAARTEVERPADPARPGGGNTAQVYALRSANVEGGAQVELNTALADATAAERAQAAGAPAPPARLEKSVTTLTSDVIRYAATEAEGRAEVPGPFTVVSQGEERGRKTRTRAGSTEKEEVAFTYVQRFDARGSRGTLTLNPSPQQTRKFPLRTGVVEGPVEFTFERTETIEGLPAPSVSRAKGRADRLELGIEGENYLVTATGNVEMDSEGEGTLGQVRAQTLIVTLDKDLRPIRYRASGAPATVKAKPGG